jgi:hypothetical protein
MEESGMNYLITPPALWDDPPVDDFPGEQLPVGGDDEPWLPECDTKETSSPR